MARPCSLDLRERVVAAVGSDLTCQEAAKRFSISHSSAIRRAQRARETGSSAALPMGGRRPSTLAAELPWITPAWQKSDPTLRALLTELRARGIDVSNFGVWHIVRRAGLTTKKSLHASEQDRPDAAWLRELWSGIRDALTRVA